MTPWFHNGEGVIAEALLEKTVAFCFFFSLLLPNLLVLGEEVEHLVNHVDTCSRVDFGG